MQLTCKVQNNKYFHFLCLKKSIKGHNANNTNGATVNFTVHPNIANIHNKLFSSIDGALNHLEIIYSIKLIAKKSVCGEERVDIE